MRNFKKVIAGALALLMLALSVNVSFAADEEFSKEQNIAMGKVTAAGIMVGDQNGDFMPTKSLTRAEAAAIVVRMKGISESATKAASGTTLFNDVAATHWASGYVNQASNLGIVKGVSATQFAPDREVTIAEFVTMAVRALGAGQLVDSEGTWPTNYVNFANENGILDDVNSIYTSVAKRVEVATIVANTLTAPMWEKVGVKSNGEIEWGKSWSVRGDAYKTILVDVLELGEDSDSFDNISTKDHTVDGQDVEENVDLATIKAGVTYHFYYSLKDNDIQGFWIEDDDTAFTEVVKTFKAGKITLKVDGKEKEYKVVAGAKVVINETEGKVFAAAIEDPATPAVPTKGKDLIGTITLNDKNEIKSMSITSYNQYAIVDKVTKSAVEFASKKIETLEGKTPVKSSIKYTDDDYEFFFTEDGKGIKLSDLEEDDAIRFYTIGKKYVGEVISSDYIVEGKVSAIGTDYVKIDGTKYTTALVNKFEVNDEVRAYLNYAKEIVMYKETEAAKVNDVAIVKSIKLNKDKDNYEVKLFTMDGNTTDTLTLDLEDIYKEWLDAEKISTTVVENALADKYADAVDKAAIVDSKKAVSGTVYTEDAGNITTGFYYTISNADNYKDLDAAVAAQKAINRTKVANDVEWDSEDEVFTYKDAKLKTSEKEAVAFYLVSNDPTKVADGYLICYEISGSELTILPKHDGEDAEFIKADADIVAGKTTRLQWSTNVCELADSVIYNVKLDSDNKVKVEKIDVASLDSSDSAVEVGLVGFDEDDEDADYVIIYSNQLARTTEANFAVITELSSTKYEDKRAMEVKVVYLDGKEETYTYCKDEADEDLDDLMELGNVVELTLNDKLIIDADQPNNTDDTIATVDFAPYVYFDRISQNKVTLAKDADTKKSLYLADEYVVLKGKFVDSENPSLGFKELKLAEIDDIDEFDSYDSTNDYFAQIWSYDDGDDNLVNVLIFIDAD